MLNLPTSTRRANSAISSARSGCFNSLSASGELMAQGIFVKISCVDLKIEGCHGKREIIMMSFNPDKIKIDLAFP